MGWDGQSLTFGCGEHGRGQLTLLGLDVADGEPSRVAVGHDGYDVVRPGHVSGRSDGFHHW